MPSNEKMQLEDSLRLGTPEQILEAFKKGRDIKHPKYPEDSYFYLGMKKVKVDGVWEEFVHYAKKVDRFGDNFSRPYDESFLRRHTDFNKFYLASYYYSIKGTKMLNFEIEGDKAYIINGAWTGKYDKVNKRIQVPTYKDEAPRYIDVSDMVVEFHPEYWSY